MGIQTYGAILKGYCQKNMLDEATELYDSISRDAGLVPDEIMFNTLLDGCARQACLSWLRLAAWLVGLLAIRFWSQQRASREQ